MRAVVLDELGMEARFRIADLPTPEPGPGQVRIRVEAVGVNPVDAATRYGQAPLSSEARFPMVLGWDAAGVIDAVGAGTVGWEVGAPVMCFSGHLATQLGTYAEEIVLAAEDVAPRPDRWSSAEAATLPSSGLSALQAMEPLELRAGEQLLVMGGAGAVGGLITQIAVSRDIEVIAVVSPGDVELAGELGARHVIDRTTDVAAQVKSLAPEGVRAAVSAARGAGAVALPAIRPGGILTSLADMEQMLPAVDNVEFRLIMVDSSDEQLRELTALANSGFITARVSRTLGLEEAALAHDLVLAGGLGGKLVLTVD